MSSAMSWIILIIAGLLEMVWATTMKQSDGFSRLTPSIVTLIAMIASVGLLALAMKSLPMGTSYMVWTGIGALGAFGTGIVLFGEAVNPLRLAAAALILAGLVLMKFATPTD
jgi:quaternary ammonium compound-resistance protein SugE